MEGVVYATPSFFKNMTFEELDKRITKFSYEWAMRLAILRNKHVILNTNKQQLLTGLTSKGLIIEPPLVSYAYAKQKRDNGYAPIWTPDLYDTGAFMNAMYVQYRKGNITISSRDKKTAILQSKYSVNGSIFGIAPNNVKLVKDHISRSFKEIFENEITK